MKSPFFLITISAAASLATVESFHLPANNGKPSPNPLSAASQQEKGQINNDIASRYSGFASKQLNQKKDSSDIASRYMSFATTTAPNNKKGLPNREPVVSTWKKEVVKEESSSSIPIKQHTDFLNFDISSSDDQEGADIQNSYRLAARAASSKKKNDLDNYHVTMAVIDEWSTALKELEDLQEEAKRGQQVFTYTNDLYNFEDSWQ